MNYLPQPSLVSTLKADLKESFQPSNITPERITELKQLMKQADSAQIIYKVDGMEWGEEALDIPTLKMEHLKWTEWSRVKYNDDGKEQSKVIDKIELEIIRKVNPLEK